MTDALPTITIRRLRETEWRAYRAIRLRALADAPDAFGSTHAVEEPKPDEYWIDRLTKASQPGQVALVAEGGKKLIGLVWGCIDPARPETAEVFQMWVAPEARGRGCDSRLLDDVVQWARDANVRTVQLRVTCGNSAARRLYVRAGFRDEGAAEPLRPGSIEQAQPMILEFPGRGVTR